MSYLVLARKYRPQTFADLVGQDHVARTLANAIATGRIAHAFLFTGVRGVGKTTSARLLAKCLNCIGAGKDSGPTATPCNVCAPCREITAGQDLDVQEIDGASYNGVDEVRRLQEGVSFRPARDRFKIYIVDEVHMLSTAAWNAFLKTLEEPPPHVKFIFATTEVHKVPVTILSRCQRYDFKLIPTQTIARRLEQVLGLESIEADAAAVQVLAREAAGSMRDAMSLLDQVIAFSGTKLTGEDVTRVLGVADRKVLHELASGLVAGDSAACLGVVDRLAQQGFDLPHVAKDILQHLRNLVVAKVCAEPAGGDAPRLASGRDQTTTRPLRELLDLADEEVADVVELAARADADDLSRIFQGFSKSFDDIVKSGQPRMALEMALVRLARRPPLLPLDELLARIGDLERRLSGAPPPPTGPAGPAGPSGSSSRGGGRAAGGPPASSFASPPPVSPAAPSRSSPPAGFASPPVATGEPAARTHGALALNDAPRPRPVEARTPETAFRPHVVAVPPPAPSAPEGAPSSGARSSTAANGAHSNSAYSNGSHAGAARLPSVVNGANGANGAPPANGSSASSSPAKVPSSASPAWSAAPFTHAPSWTTANAPSASRPPPAPPPREVVPMDPAETARMEQWRAILERVRAARPAIASTFEHAMPLVIGPDQVVVGFDASARFTATRAAEADAQEELTRAVREHFKAETRVTIDTEAKANAGVRTIAAIDADARLARAAQARSAIEHHPLVEEAIKVFGAQLRDVKLPSHDS